MKYFIQLNNQDDMKIKVRNPHFKNVVFSEPIHASCAGKNWTKWEKNGNEWGKSFHWRIPYSSLIENAPQKWVSFICSLIKNSVTTTGRCCSNRTQNLWNLSPNISSLIITQSVSHIFNAQPSYIEMYTI